MPVISAPHLENVRSLIIIIEQKKEQNQIRLTRLYFPFQRTKQSFSLQQEYGKLYIANHIARVWLSLSSVTILLDKNHEKLNCWLSCRMQ